MKKHFTISAYNYDSLIKPILFLILGIVLLTNPNGVVIWSLYIFAIVLFFIGFFKNLLYYKKPEDKKDVVTGTIYMVLAAVIAIVTFFFFNIVQLIFRIALAVLLCYTGVIRIIYDFKQPKNIKKIYLTSSIIIILFAIILAIFSNIEMWTIGLIIILYSILEIVGYVMNRKYIDENAEIKEAAIVKEIETDNKE